jgi:DNA-directed RNA polymerase subunit F
MIKSTNVQTLGEVKAILEDISKEENEENKKIKETLTYLKKFVKSKPEHIKKLKEAVQNLNLDKLNQKSIAKIVDLMPEDAEDLKKIFFGEDINLEQDEISTILETLKRTK